MSKMAETEVWKIFKTCRKWSTWSITKSAKKKKNESEKAKPQANRIEWQIIIKGLQQIVTTNRGSSSVLRF